MEIHTTFETYIVVDDEEFRVEVEAAGDIVEDGFSHEFGFTAKPYIDNVFINSIYDIENDKDIVFKSLTKAQQRELLLSAEEELNENEMTETYYESV